MPNYCFNGISIKYRDKYERCDDEDIMDDIDFHLRNPLFDNQDEIWNEIKDRSYTKPQEGKYHKFYNEKMSDRDHSKLIKYPLEKSDMIRFSNIIAEPKEFPIKLDNGDELDWYWWRVNNWGTKWDGFDYDNIIKTDHDLYITGCTAWSPCEPTIKRISEIYPEVNIQLEYDEPGCAFCGRVEYEEGNLISELTENDFADYRHAAKEMEMAPDILYTCVKCKNLFYDFEIDDEDNFECDTCGSHIFVHDTGYYVETQDGNDNLYGKEVNNINQSYEEFFN